ALSVAIAWLYGRTQGSLLLAMLMHSAVNQTIGIVSDLLPSGEKAFVLGASLSFLLTIAWMWLAAAFFLFRMRRLPVLNIGTNCLNYWMSTPQDRMADQSGSHPREKRRAAQTSLMRGGARWGTRHQGPGQTVRRGGRSVSGEMVRQAVKVLEEHPNAY